MDDKGVISGAFDREYYLRVYPDIVKAGADPLDHFCDLGWREGRDPCDWFSTTYYLGTHKDVARAGVNPFVHYLKFGRSEGRPIKYPLARDLRLDPNVSLITDVELLDILRYPSRPILTRESSFDPKMLDIHWVIPDYGVSDGGQMTIFRIVRWLELFGHRCTIWINHPTIHSSSSEAFEDIIKHYQTIKSDVRFVADGFLHASGDAVIATNWQSVQIVSHAQTFKDRFYFVQDYEPNFHARGTLSLLAELTYMKDLACICCGTWLERIMRDRYRRWARHFWLAADESAYFRPSKSRPPNKVPRIAFYGRIKNSRRAVELGLLALQHLASQNIVFHVDLFGAFPEVSCTPFPCTLHGNLDSEELGELYRSADLGLCFSTTNYSIVPQEMMACGLAVVEIDVESTRAIFPEGVVTLCAPHPLDIADGLATLLRDSDRRHRQAETARAWASSFSWERSARLVESALHDRLFERGYKRRTRLITSAGPYSKVRASVFIPTYNGGDLFKAVINQVRRQRSPWRFEIIVIDSSSIDGTGEYCRDAADIVFEQIVQSEFSHGQTRNRGVELARGDFVAFLTQDALPTDEFWLYNLVSLLEAYPYAAGAFGRHMPWPHHSPFVKRDITEHFKRLDASPVAVSKETDPERWESGDTSWRQFLHFYSDNNSCLRRSVWQKIPLPKIFYGEDQLWANQVIAAGYQKVYAHAATVYHSHDYDYAAAAKRAEEEAIFFKLSFGYDLIKSENDLEAALARDNENDSRWAILHGISEEDLRRRLSLNKARLEGHLSGYRKGSASIAKAK
jgi:glycosyltransferase involved in cell wall biosynthesis